MATAAPDNARRFQTAAQHYFARPDYSPRLIARVAELVRLGPADRIMDLGCGTGMLAVAFAPLVGSVVAVDPEAEMLTLAEKAARGVRSKVTFVEGGSGDLGPHFGTFRFVAIGRAFHWMDREDTLRRLDTILEPDGALALFNVRDVRTRESAWIDEYLAIIERHAVGEVIQRPPGVKDHPSVLLKSPFSRLERVSAIERRAVNADLLVSRALSMSRTAPGRIGTEGVARLTADIRAMAARVAGGGPLTEVSESEALLARRPGP